MFTSEPLAEPMSERDYGDLSRKASILSIVTLDERMLIDGERLTGYVQYLTVLSPGALI